MSIAGSDSLLGEELACAGAEHHAGQLAVWLCVIPVAPKLMVDATVAAPLLPGRREGCQEHSDSWTCSVPRACCRLQLNTRG